MTARNGLLIVNKPSGPTSHDVVAQARRLLSTRSVGHAGTLDPLASGVLLLLVGEATKLSLALTLERKSYRARIHFGVATDSDDSMGKPTESCEVTPDWLTQERLALAIQKERQRISQVPPRVCAIKQGGVAAYQRHRRGELVELVERDVQVHEMNVLSTSDYHVELELEVSKGYYVRSLARDLGTTLGVPAHLAALCRTRSGEFRLDEAIEWPRSDVPPLVPMSEVVRRVMPVNVLAEEGVRRARLGQKLQPDHFSTIALSSSTAGVLTAWVDAASELVALGCNDADGTSRVVRGFGSGQQNSINGIPTILRQS